MTDRLLRGVVFVLLLIGFTDSIPSFAQKITGDVSGTVTDASGAAVSGAIVRAQNTGTGENQTATTNETGFFRIVNLNPGQYRLSVEASGFKTMERQASVDIALTTQANFSLQVGSRTETVEVQGVAPLVEATEDRLSTLFVGREVQDLPNNGGDFTNQLDGNLFWNRHTDAFDARNWFASSVTPFRLNQFGASGGFPIKKDKAFLYMSYQGFHLKDVFPSTVSLPAQAQINDALGCVE